MEQLWPRKFHFLGFACIKQPMKVYIVMTNNYADKIRFLLFDGELKILNHIDGKFPDMRYTGPQQLSINLRAIA